MAYSLAKSSYGQSIEAFLVPDGKSAGNTAGAGGGGNDNPPSGSVGNDSL